MRGKRRLANEKETQREGVSAFAEGKPDTDCPYKSNGNAADVSQNRIWWMNGYYAAHAVANVRGVTSPKSSRNLTLRNQTCKIRGNFPKGTT